MSTYLKRGWLSECFSVKATASEHGAVVFLFGHLIWQSPQWLACSFGDDEKAWFKVPSEPCRPTQIVLMVTEGKKHHAVCNWEVHIWWEIMVLQGKKI